MRRITILALAGALTALAIPATASAHEASVVPTCDGGISIHFDSFAQGPVTFSYTVTDNGTQVANSSVSGTGPSGDLSASFPAPTVPGDHAVSVAVTWTADGGGSATGEANCPVEAPPPPPQTVPQVQVCYNGETVTVPVDKQPPGSVTGECKEEYVPPSIPELVPNDKQPKVHEIEGKEEQRPKQQPQPEETQTVAAGETLPFTGPNYGILFLVGLGIGLVGAGFIGRKATRSH